MDKITSSISNFFQVNFRKKFVMVSAIPFLICSIFMIDYHVLPEFNTSDTVVSYQRVRESYMAGPTGNRKTRTIGYKYVTQKNYTFSTYKKRLKINSVELSVSPLFKTVKIVKVGNKEIEAQSGPSGINGALIFAVFISLAFCICYVLLKKKISNNARLNIIYFNILLLVAWAYLFIRFVL